MYRIIAALAIGLLSACASAPSRAVLHPCGSDALGRASCGTVRVAEDPRKPSGRTIDVAFMVLHATGASPKPDAILFFAGGPGQAGTAVAPLAAQALAGARAERDIILVDQRGTGKSNPLACGPASNELDALVGAFVSGGLSIADITRCRDELSQRADLRLYTTPIAMQDFDRVRAALGVREVNLVGGSYGSRAALEYARQFPGRVRTVVLRGGGTTELRLPLNVPRDVEDAFDALFRDCAADAACASRYGDLRAKLNSVVKTLAAAPRTMQTVDPRTKQPARVTIDSSVFLGGIIFAMYSSDTAAFVPLLIDRAAAGAFEPFLALAIPTTVALANQVHLGMHFSVVCAEDVPRFTIDEVREASQGTMLGELTARTMMDRCEVWPRGAVPASFHEPFRVGAPVLILSGAADPALPPRYGEIDLRTMPNARHVVLPASSHVPLFPGCAADLVTRFLDSASFATLDFTCVQELKRPPWR